MSTELAAVATRFVDDPSGLSSSHDTGIAFNVASVDGELGHTSAIVDQTLDDPRWMELARQRGFHLPYKTTRCTTEGMEHWLRRLGFSVKWFLEYTGFERLSDWPAANPTWGLRSFVGLLLEEL